MNYVSGMVKEISDCDGIAEVIFTDSAGVEYRSIVFDARDSKAYARRGARVCAAFKESELVLIKGSAKAVSASNRIPGTIVSIQSGTVVSKIGLACGNDTFYVLLSSSSVSEMDISIGDSVTALVNATSISFVPGR